jgi:hypothetical protein
MTYIEYLNSGVEEYDAALLKGPARAFFVLSASENETNFE